MSRGNDSRIYVGNLPPDIRTKDIEDLFYKFGKINFIDLKNKRGPPFAFIEFDDPRDAEDAVHARDGYDYDGYKLRVEFPRGSGPDGRRRGGFGGGRGGGGSRGGPPSRRSQYRVLVTGLPPSGSWQDLKDHMREAGDVCFTDVFKDGTGIVEFLKYDDMKYALRKLDDSKFRSHEIAFKFAQRKASASDVHHLLIVIIFRPYGSDLVLRNAISVLVEMISAVASVLIAAHAAAPHRRRSELMSRMNV
ncbi:unnamed protein product, partial [Cyprideis torosa]